MNKTNILLVGVLLLVAGCGTKITDWGEYKIEDEVSRRLCESLELQDYTYSCTSRDINEGLDEPTSIEEHYEVRCEFDSRKFAGSVGEYGCGIDFLAEKHNVSGIREVSHCNAETVESAFLRCWERLPSQLKEVKVTLDGEEVGLI